MFSRRHLKRLVKKELIVMQQHTNNETNSDNELIDMQQNTNNETNSDKDESVENRENVQYCGNEFDTQNIYVEETGSLKTDLRDWSIEHNISRTAFDNLLRILKKWNNDVPVCSESIVEKTKSVIRSVSPGTYTHLGIENNLHKISKLIIESKIEIIQLVIGVDGLPLYKSSSVALWPIMAKIYPSINEKVMLVGVFVGKKKPFSSNCFLHDFAAEFSHLKENGINIRGKQFQVVIRSFICDAPVKAFLCQTVGHNAFVGCGRCLQIGKRINNRTAFSTTKALPRTNADFLERKHLNFHKRFPDQDLHLENMGIDMITQFPLDAMHLIDLGVGKKIISFLVNKQNKTKKLSNEEIEKISENLINFSSHVPVEFNRKPRSLDEICRWKAVEFRQFILYTGIVAFKNIVDEHVYDHFLLLHCAYRLLSNELNYKENLPVADEIIQYFVQLFPLIYGEDKVSFNVHSLLHIVECIEQIGFINTFTAYDFENYMQELKKSVKKPSKILEQIQNKNFVRNLVQKKRFVGIKRNRLGEIKSYQNDKCFLDTKTPNNYFSKDWVGYELIRFIEQDGVKIVAKRLLNCQPFFLKPLNSYQDLGIFLANKISSEVEEIIDLHLLQYKLFRLPYNSVNLFLPILHSRNY